MFATNENNKYTISSLFKLTEELKTAKNDVEAELRRLKFDLDSKQSDIDRLEEEKKSLNR